MVPGSKRSIDWRMATYCRSVRFHSWIPSVAIALPLSTQYDTHVSHRHNLGMIVPRSDRGRPRASPPSLLHGRAPGLDARVFKDPGTGEDIAPDTTMTLECPGHPEDGVGTPPEPNAPPIECQQFG